MIQKSKLIIFWGLVVLLTISGLLLLPTFGYIRNITQKGFGKFGRGDEIHLEILVPEIIGITSFVLLGIAILLGSGKIRLKICRTTNLSNKLLINLHCQLSWSAIGLGLFHAMLLSFTRRWSDNFDVLGFLPTLKTVMYFNFETLFFLSSDNEFVEFGLELGRWGILLMLIAAFAGLIISGLIALVGRRQALFTQQLTLVSFIFALWHASLTGGPYNSINAFIYVILEIFTLIVVSLWFYNVIQAIKRWKKKHVRVTKEKKDIKQTSRWERFLKSFKKPVIDDYKLLTRSILTVISTFISYWCLSNEGVSLTNIESFIAFITGILGFTWFLSIFIDIYYKNRKRTVEDIMCLVK